MALIPIEERVEPSTEVRDVPGYGGRYRQLAYPVNEIVLEIQDSARSAGFSNPNEFTIFSGYRSDASQTQLFEQRVNQLMQRNPSLGRSEAERLARKTVAPPGRSSHRTGYAFDIYLGHKPGYSISSSDSANVNHIFSTDAYRFMSDIAHRYGITQLPNEPWHWECDSVCREAYMNRSTSTPTEPTSTVVAKTQSTERYKAIAAALIVGAASVGTWHIIKRARS